MLEELRGVLKSKQSSRDGGLKSQRSEKVRNNGGLSCTSAIWNMLLIGRYDFDLRLLKARYHKYNEWRPVSNLREVCSLILVMCWWQFPREYRYPCLLKICLCC